MLAFRSTIFLKIFHVFFNFTGKQFDANSPRSVFMIWAAWPHPDWSDELQVWMSKKASASGTDIAPEFTFFSSPTPTIYETSKCILHSSLLF